MTDELSVEKIPWQINANPHSLGRPLNMVALLLTKRARKIALTEKNLHVLNILPMIFGVATAITIPK